MRRRWFAVALVLALPVHAQSPDRSLDKWLIVPGKSVGQISAQTTRADLVRIFGAGEVKEEMVGPGGDQEAVLATVVNGKHPDSQLTIFWDKLDKAGHHPDATAHPEFINVCYGSGPRPTTCKWHLANGISLGTSLRELEALNGRSFVLAGFGWDYEGVVLDWKGGNLSGLKGCGGVRLALMPPAQDIEQSSCKATLYEQVTGDKEFSSAFPAMQQLNPPVDLMTVGFANSENCPAKKAADGRDACLCGE